MHHALYSEPKFSFGKVYTAFVGNPLYTMSHKMIPCAVLLESFKNFETLIRRRRTLREPLDLAQDTQTSLKLTTGRKSLIKQQILTYKIAVCTIVNGVITH